MILGQENDDAKPYLEKQVRNAVKAHERVRTINQSKKIMMWIEWSEEDAAFIGYCPQFFPHRAVCHGHTQAKAVAQLASIVRDELGEQTRPRMRRARSAEVKNL
jgi:hypothetical protein